MKLLSQIVARLFDLIDLVFDIAATLLRVLIRGAFAPDARAFRGERFAPLKPSDVLVQEVAINAEDKDQAKKIIGLDEDAYLPLSSAHAVFDLAGPLDEDDALRARPERPFLLGVMHKEKLASAREDLPGGRRGVVEQFVFTPPQQAGAWLAFSDEQGIKRRRLRRATLAAALALFVYAGWTAHDTFEAALDHALATAQDEEAQAEHRLRLAERRQHDAQANLSTARQSKGRDIGALDQTLARLALQTPASAEIDAVEASGQSLTVHGKAYAPDDTELAFRRAFEGQAIDYTASPGPAPQSFDARFSSLGAAAGTP